MTSATARTTANVVLAAAGLAAAYVVITTPPLRRLASTGLRLWLGAGIPAYFFAEVRRGWIEAGRAA